VEEDGGTYSELDEGGGDEEGGGVHFELDEAGTYTDVEVCWVEIEVDDSQGVVDSGGGTYFEVDVGRSKGVVVDVSQSVERLGAG
jgi:hypothetical protein